MGDVCPLHSPLALRAVPYWGENTLLSSLRGICPRIFKGKFICYGGRRGVGNFDLSMPFRVWAS